jgi:Nuclease A inhibitor-like protein
MPKKNATLDALEKAVKGLVYASEGEAKLEPFLWKETGDPDEKRLLERAEVPSDTPVEEATLDSFFRTVPPEDKANFDKLAKTLADLLTVIKVYKLGDECEKQVYVVGKTSDGQWAGFKTTVVET